MGDSRRLERHTFDEYCRMLRMALSEAGFSYLTIGETDEGDGVAMAIGKVRELGPLTPRESEAITRAVRLVDLAMFGPDAPVTASTIQEDRPIREVR